MPKVLQCTAFFGSDAGRGWSESHHLEVATPVGDLLPRLQAFKTLMDNFRRPLLGKDRYLAGLKVSYPTDDGNVASSAWRYQPVSYPGNQREGCAPTICAVTRLGEITNTKFSNMKLRGFWDAVEQNEELNFNTGPGGAWKALLDEYVAQLVINDYGWLAQDGTATVRGNITNYAANVNGTITFTVNVTSAAPMLPDGTITEFRAARLNNSDSVLNDTFVVQVTSPTTLTTVKKVAAGAFQTAGTFVISVKNFAAYTGMQYCILGKQSEGSPTNRSPARRKARARS